MRIGGGGVEGVGVDLKFLIDLPGRQTPRVPAGLALLALHDTPLPASPSPSPAPAPAIRALYFLFLPFFLPLAL